MKTGLVDSWMVGVMGSRKRDPNYPAIQQSIHPLMASVARLFKNL